MLPTSPLSRLDEQTRVSFLPRAAAREGALAVFTERPAFCLVRVSNIAVAASGFELRITLEPDAGLGFGNPERRFADIGAVWNGFYSDDLEWQSFPYANWYLYFDPALCATIREAIDLAHAESQPLLYDRLLLHVKRWRLANNRI